MKNIVRLAPPAVLLSLFLTTAAWAAPVGRTIQRPISDFLENQSINGSNMWGVFVADQTVRLAYVDYTGRMAQNLRDHAGIDLHTTFDGAVHERPFLVNGEVFAEVTVELHFKNALTNVQTMYLDEFGYPVSLVPTMGVTWGDVLNHYGLPWNDPPDLEGTLEPYNFPFALGSGTLKWVYIAPAFGDDIRNLLETFGYVPDPTKAPITPVMLQFECTGTGPLWAAAGLGPDGTPGKLKISQLYLPHTGSGNLPGHDGWPVEIVNLWRVGR